MRHAKSDWGNNLPDIERPLNNRGKKAAPLMADYLRKADKNIDIILSSPAKRALSTAQIIKEVLNLDKDIQIAKAFYFGYTNELIGTIKAIAHKYDTALIVGHNPVWEDLVSDLTGNPYITMPTAAIASILFDMDDWQNLNETKAKLEWLITPKSLKNNF